jgi:hypothetical protein
MLNLTDSKDVAMHLHRYVLAHYSGGFDLAKKAHDEVIEKMLCIGTLIDILSESTRIEEFTSSLEKCGFLDITRVGVHKSLLSKGLFALAKEGLAARAVESDRAAQISRATPLEETRLVTLIDGHDPHWCTELVLFGSFNFPDRNDTKRPLAICDGPPRAPIHIMDLNDYWLNWHAEYQGFVIDEDLVDEDERNSIPSDHVPRRIRVVMSEHARPDHTFKPPVTKVWIPAGSAALIALDDLIARKCPPHYMYHGNHQRECECECECEQEQGRYCEQETIVITPICTGCDMCSAEASSGAEASGDSTGPLSTPPRKEPVPKRKRASSDRAKDKRRKLTTLEVIDLTEE